MDKLCASKRENFYSVMYMLYTISTYTGDFSELESAWTQREVTPHEFPWESHRMHNYICEQLGLSEKVEVKQLWAKHCDACKPSVSQSWSVACDEERSLSPSWEDLCSESC